MSKNRRSPDTAAIKREKKFNVAVKSCMQCSMHQNGITGVQSNLDILSAMTHLVSIVKFERFFV